MYMYIKLLFQEAVSFCELVGVGRDCEAFPPFFGGIEATEGGKVRVIADAATGNRRFGFVVQDGCCACCACCACCVCCYTYPSGHLVLGLSDDISKVGDFSDSREITKQWREVRGTYFTCTHTCLSQRHTHHRQQHNAYNDSRSHFSISCFFVFVSFLYCAVVFPFLCYLFPFRGLR